MDFTSLPRVDQLPAPVSPTPVPPEQVAANRQIVGAVRALNKAELLGQDHELTFLLDRQTQKPVIQIVDRNTREVIQQIPPEYVLLVAQELAQDAPKASAQGAQSF